MTKNFTATNSFIKKSLSIILAFVLVFSGNLSVAGLTLNAETKSSFNTNLSSFVYSRGAWEERETGLYSKGNGDNFAISDVSGDNFIYSADVFFDEGNNNGAASLVFRAQAEAGQPSYVANVEGTRARIFKFTSGGGAVDLGTSTIERKDSYNMRVEAIGNSLKLYVDDILKIAAVDNSAPFMSGQFGLLTFNTAITYQNVIQTPIDTNDIPKLTGLSSSGCEIYFSENATSYMDWVEHDITSIKVTPESSENSSITISAVDADSQITFAEQAILSGLESPDIDLSVGINTINIKIKNDTTGVAITTPIFIERNFDKSEFYLEPYRPQMHFTTVNQSYINDPNGLIYDPSNQTWHMFFQYSPPTGGGPRWGHAQSDDLIHWSELPVAIPQGDGLGMIFSGSAIVDEDNDSGFFDDNVPGQSKLIAFFTHHGGDETDGLEKQSMAYSVNHGLTWTLYEGNPIIKNPGNYYSTDFRDPKVFKHDGKWLMVVAGGRGRIFSSDNLIDWELDSEMFFKNGTSELHSECPDMYPMEFEGETKWIYTASGQWYVIGDLIKNAADKYEFIPETDPIAYNGSSGYATQTYFNDFGDGRRIAVSWLIDFISQNNSSEAFQSKIWQGTQSFPQVVELKKIDGQLRLNTYPVEELNGQRSEEPVVSIANQTVSPTTHNILSSVAGKKYDIEATINMGTAKEVGFNLMTGDGHHATLKYNDETEQLILDRSNVTISTDFFGSANTHYSAMKKDAEGNIKLRIIMDTTVVEAFGNDGEASFNQAFFPDVNNVGLEFYALGGEATVTDMKIYNMESTYRQDIGDTTPAKLILNTNAKSNFIELDKEAVFSASILPMGAVGEIQWQISDTQILEIISQTANSITVKALENGPVNVKATVEGTALTESLDMAVAESNFTTNMSGWRGVSGNWRETPVGFSADNKSLGDCIAMSDDTATAFTYEADVKNLSGIAAIIWGIEDADNPIGNKWFCLNTDGNTARMFYNSGKDKGDKLIWDKSRPLTDAEKKAPALTLKVVVTKDGTMTTYLNGTMVASFIDSSFDGGGFGLLTNFARVDFDNVNLNSESSNFTTNMNGWHGVRGNWAETANGFTASNKGKNSDDFAMSSNTATSFTYEADVKNLDGIAALIWGIEDPANPIGNKWFCLNTDGNTARMFYNSGKDKGDKLIWDKSRPLTTEEKTADKLTLKVVVGEDGTMTTYLNGAVVGSQIQSDFTGGMLGLLTFNGNVDFNNVNLTVDNTDFKTNMTGWHQVSGNWSNTANGVFAGNKDLGDSTFMSENRASAFEIEADIDDFDGVASGIIFGVSNLQNPTASPWYCVNVDKTNKIAKLFYNGGGYEVWKESRPLTDEEMASTSFHLKLTVSEDGTITYILNDSPTKVTRKVDGFVGGEIGLLTYRANSTFNNVYLATQSKTYNMSNDFSKTTSDGEIWKYQYVTHNQNDYKPLPSLAPDNRWREFADNGSWQYGYVGAGVIHPAIQNNIDTVITFVAPESGFINLSASGPIAFPYNSTDGVHLKVMKNNDKIWPTERDWKTYTADMGGVDFGTIGTYVNAGDQIHFVVNLIGSGQFDDLIWNPEIEYVDLGLSDYNLNLYIGSSAQISASSETASWSSTDESVATVDENGTIKTLGIGKTDIVVRDGDNIVKCLVEVNMPKLSTSPIAVSNPNDDTIRASASITNDLMSQGYRPVVLFALYDNMGRLCASKEIKDISIGIDGNEIFFADFDVRDIENPLIKLFVLDSYLAYTPIEEAKTYELGIWRDYVSAIANSTNNNELVYFDAPTYTFRTYVKPVRDYGENTWRFWYSNIQDASRGSDQVHQENRPGDAWVIEEAYIADGGTSANGSIVENTLKQVTYDGATSKTVSPYEQFWSDEVEFDLPEGHYMCFIWTVSPVKNQGVPFSAESLAPSFLQPGYFATQTSNSGFRYSNGWGLTPNLYAVKKNVAKKMSFIGDSITQGVGTSVGQYDFWVSKVAKGLGADVSVWNHGLGWARAYDGASDGAWLSKAKQGDEISLVLGVNDISSALRTSEQVIADITKMVASVRMANPNAIITLFTVPTFDYNAEKVIIWREVNDFIRSKPTNVDYVFDVAAVLSKPAPNDGYVIDEYKASPADAHPGALGCTAIADAYLGWYANRD